MAYIIIGHIDRCIIIHSIPQKNWYSKLKAAPLVSFNLALVIIADRYSIYTVYSVSLMHYEYF
jgi:hypothetical protein